MNYPRVTEVLRAFSKYEYVPHEILERAAERGTKVHAICAGIAAGEFIPDTMIDEELTGYVASFKQWATAQVDKFLVIEQRYTDETDGYSGQVDFVVEANDKSLYLVDIKTGVNRNRTHPVQMAAYAHLLLVHKVYIRGAMLVYLDKDGDFPDIHLLEDMNNDWPVFQAALTCWNYFNKKKEKA
jgi:hypothetical protein